MTIDIKQIRKFVAVAEARNFTRAAEVLHMTQPSLSKQISQLEDQLSTLLFQRESRPIRLTEAGRRFYEDSLAVLDRIEQMEITARRLGLSSKRIFNVGFVASALYGGLPTVMRRLMEQRPDLDVRWLEMTSVEQQDALRRGLIDVGFGRIITGDASVKRVILREERLFLAISPEHRLSKKRTAVRLHELDGCALVVYPSKPRPSFADQVLSLLREHGARPQEVHEVKELQTALALVTAGSGVCLIPATARHLRPALVYRPTQDADAVSPIVMNYRAKDEDPVIEVIKAVTRKLFSEAPAWLEPAYNKIPQF
ncbi:DNA-binding transcriptional regulator, LysR family [Pseudoxanthomonas sp. GM95]|uniref:LysR family transcriptional regulator n=1 Tax=Pseudoxanthomonas sp. GM95 TaxID=1881043 RepID=UPI0008B68429|nr:LysR family transcriptional regulator [Pseudoxanthomonas sp. GM95]SEM53538.1 DNA-binding transcriptional regulator, LysR family [Pseudoxanthomonas sp. GM95]